MKLTKENVYVDLIGKTEEELTELYNFLISVGEKPFRDKEWFLNYSNDDEKVGFSNFHFCGLGNVLYKDKTEVTIEQLKEILQPMGTFTPIAMKCTQEQFDAVKPKLKGCKVRSISNFNLCEYLTNNLHGDSSNIVSNISKSHKTKHNGVVYETWNEEIFLKACGIEVESLEQQLIKEAKERGFLTEGNEFYSCFSDKNKLRIIKPYNSKLEINLYLDKGGCLRYYDGLNNKYDESLCSNPAIYKDGVWAEIKNNSLTLTEQLQKAEAEVKRLKSLIEEENKPKVGDLVKCSNKNSNAKCVIGIVEDLHYGFIGVGGHWYDKFEKITDPILSESLNKLF